MDPMYTSDIAMDITVLSLTLNALVLITAISKRISDNIFSSQCGLMETFSGEENGKQSIGSRASRTSTRVLMSIFGPVAGLYLLLDSSITQMPFIVTSPLMSHCFTALLAFYTFEFLVPLLDATKPFKGYAEICHHAVSIILYLSIVITKTNALLGLIGLLAVGDLFMQEVVSLSKYFPRSKQSVGYLICLFLRAVAMGTYRIILPLVTFCVTMANGVGQLQQMSAFNNGIFFFSVIFYTFYYVWSYVSEMQDLYVEFKKAVPRRNKDSKTLEVKSEMKLPSLKMEGNRKVRNEYVFDLSETNLGMPDAFSGVCTKTVASEEYGPDSEPTHFYI